MAILTNMKVPGIGTDENSLVIMPKLSNRFRIRFTFSEGGNSNGNFITGNVMTVTKPTLSFDPIQLDVYNSRIYIPGKHTWNPVTITLRDDVASSASKVINTQINKQIDMVTQSTSLAASSFKFVTVIESLDGGNSNPSVIDSWVMAGCYIENVEYGNNDYSTADPVQISLTLKYDNAVNIPAASISGNINATAGDVTLPTGQ